MAARADIAQAAQATAHDGSSSASLPIDVTFQEIAEGIFSALPGPHGYLFVHLDAISSDYPSLFFKGAHLIYNRIARGDINTGTLWFMWHLWQLGDCMLVVADVGSSMGDHHDIKTLVLYMHPRHERHRLELAQCYAALAYLRRIDDPFSATRADSLVKRWTGLSASSITYETGVDVLRAKVRWVNKGYGTSRRTQWSRNVMQFLRREIAALKELLTPSLTIAAAPAEYVRLSRTILERLRNEESVLDASTSTPVRLLVRAWEWVDELGGGVRGGLASDRGSGAIMVREPQRAVSWMETNAVRLSASVDILAQQRDAGEQRDRPGAAEEHELEGMLEALAGDGTPLVPRLGIRGRAASRAVVGL